MQRKVYLEGEIGDRFGHEFDMNVASFGEAISCLEANFPEFREYLIDCDTKGVTFTCQIGDTPVERDEELFLKYSKGDIIITAVPAGSNGGLGKLILGIILIAAAYYLGPLGTSLADGVGVALSAGQAWAVASIGINLALTGIQEMMAPDPSVDTQQDESYLFQGAGQTILEGDPVPILYGKLRVPGRPISFEVKNAQRQFTDYVQPGADYVEANDSGGSAESPGSEDSGKSTSQEGGYSSE